MMDQPVSNNFKMIYIASCGEGINASHLVESTLVQFPDSDITVVKVPHIRAESQVDDLLGRIKDVERLIAHTIVDPNLRHYLVTKAEEQSVITIDLMGQVLDKIERFLGIAPLGTPGLYRETHQVDLKQVTAIDFALSHDDGLKPESLEAAEIVLVGLSRAGK
ncbi:MAG: kinase/pyrophosphorylase, partial [Desulforhopalus sp.]|nr:kinase/pyrophosphorylase [Desulforhopalus sp.]